MFRRFAKGLSLKTRIRVILEIGAVAIAIYTVVLGHPPAKAQHRGDQLVVQQVLTDADSKRDVEIEKLKEFREEQRVVNHDTAATLANHDASINRFWGGIAVIIALVGGSIGVSLKTARGK